jgi:exopolysaccharide biosynthesis polyprenyl glycosylphosphotransferase
MNIFGSGLWISVAIRALRDVALFVAAYLVANYIRFTTFWRIDDYVLPIIVGATALISVNYIFGTYSVESNRRSTFVHHFILLGFSFLLALVVMTLVGYLSFDQRIGRGFMALGSVFSFPLLVINHWLIFHKHSFAPERIAFVAESEDELEEYRRIREMCPTGVQVVGRLGLRQTNTEEPDFLGRLKNARKIVRANRIDRIVFSEHLLEDEDARWQFRRLRYLGFPCSSITTVCEKYLHYVPLHLVCMNWLLQSENASRNLYFSKLKRLFDILTSVVLLILSAPILLLGMAIVRFFSPEGSVFYLQERVGRFGKKFMIYKLRSMRTDAESAGAVWSTVGKDPRVFPGGAFLRRYRIDEIPQLINILRGEMSFVGPRPERPEFVTQLASKLPYYQERHMIQPGLTGWAQVSYPYGASIEDSKCKLEYDLYYLKHAGVIFDTLILLDTVRVVLGGGLKHTQSSRYSATVKPPSVLDEEFEEMAADSPSGNP